MSRSRNYCFTLNNYTETKLNWLKDVPINGDKPFARYIVFGEEIAPTTGTPHLQGYIELSNAMTISALKKRLQSNEIHIEERKGTALQAITYCKKEGKYHEAGTPSQQGHRTDIDEIAALAMDKTINLKQVAETSPATYIKFHKGIQALRCLQYEHRTKQPQVYWRWGLSGVGKTHYPTTHHPSHYIKDGTMWWDNYTQEEAIIIDDFDGKWPYRDFLRLLDKHKYQGQVKGGFMPINSPYIYITCEHHPSHYWTGNELKQVCRRLTKITNVIGPGNEIDENDTETEPEPEEI